MHLVENHFAIFSKRHQRQIGRSAIHIAIVLELRLY